MVKAVCVLKGEAVNGTVYFEQVFHLLLLQLLLPIRKAPAL